MQFIKQTVKKIKSLDSRGISHIIVPLGVIVLISLMGTATLLASHANPKSHKTQKAHTSISKVRAKTSAKKLPRAKPAVITIKAYYPKCKTSKKQATGPGVDNTVYNANTERWTNCKGQIGSHSNLHVTNVGFYDVGVTCNGKVIGVDTNLGKTRRLSCVTAVAHTADIAVYLENSASVNYRCGKSNCISDSNKRLQPAAGSRTSIKLGSSRR